MRLDQEMTDRLTKISESYCDGLGGCHGPDHVQRVLGAGLYIARRMGADVAIITAAALLHDIGRAEETASQGRVCHARLGGQMARRILKEHGFPAEGIEAVAHCIETHRFRGDVAPETLEAKILFDADKLDSIGAVGIGRAFLFAGQVGARLHNGHLDIEKTRAYSSEDTAYREFRVKLCKVRERMLTPVGAQLAEERHAFMELYFKQLDRETQLT